MTSIIDVAQYLIDGYRRMYKKPIYETQLHKLLYLAQRESYAVFNEPLFAEGMQGWKYGPVSPEVRQRFAGTSVNVFAGAPSDEVAALLDNVLAEYGGCSSRSLTDLTHRETSWRNSREGLRDNEKGDRVLRAEDIQYDALQARPYFELHGEYATLTPVGQDALPRRDLEVPRETAEERLSVIAALEDGWRGNGTKAFASDLIDRIGELIITLPLVPLPVPSIRGGIQLEFEDRIRGFLAITIFSNNLAEVYAVSPSGSYEAESTIRGDDVQAKVQAFQEGRIWRS